MTDVSKEGEGKGRAERKRAEESRTEASDFGESLVRNTRREDRIGEGERTQESAEDRREEVHSALAGVS